MIFAGDAVMLCAELLATGVLIKCGAEGDGSDVLGRFAACVDWLEERVTPDGFGPGTFSIMDISLMCPLLYGEARDAFQFRTGQWPAIAVMVDALQERPSVMATPVVPR